MSVFDRIVLLIVRITGVAQVLLGITLWTGYALQLIPLHMLIGIVFVLALLILAVRAIVKGAAPGLGSLTLGWGVLTVVFGMTQMQILPGPYHWVIRVLHLLVGIAAMSLGDRLGRRIKETHPTRPAVMGARPV